MVEFFKKIRPQIILAIFTLGLVSVVALCRDGEQYIAVVTGCTGGIIALGMKLLDGEQFWPIGQNEFKPISLGGLTLIVYDCNTATLGV